MPWANVNRQRTQHNCSATVVKVLQFLKQKRTGSEVSSSSLGATVITFGSPLRTMGCGIIDAPFGDCNGDDPF